MPTWHFVLPLRMARISVTISVVFLFEVSISQVFSGSCSFSASTRHTSRISEARFSHSLRPVMPAFSICLRSLTGLRRRTKV